MGTATDAATPAVDTTNETSGPPGVLNIDGIQSIPAAGNISCRTIADQLAERGGTSDLTPPLTSSSIVFIYAVKHNPFVYFRSIQEGDEPNSSLANLVGFDGSNGLLF